MAQNKKTTEKKDEAKVYLDHLLNDGCNEHISGEMELPPWYDENLVSRGQSFLQKYRFMIMSGMLSGLIAVLAIPSILKVLIATKQSGTAKMAYRRYTKTILHTHAWHSYPIKPGTKAWESIEMVRKGHIRSSNISDQSKSGKITQKDLALTQFGFMGFSTLDADKLGLDDPKFHEATIHLWRVIGYLLGIKDEYNLCTESWETTRPRLELVLNRIYKPMLENTTEEFNEMTKALLDGLWPTNTMLDWETSIFGCKHDAKCKGYEFFKDDDFGSDQKYFEFYKMGWFKRLEMSYGMLLVYTLYKYTIFRRYLNFRIWLIENWSYYFPYLAFYKFGIRWAYVRIFNKSDEDENLHEE